MADAIFLSASVPDPKRGPEYAATANSVAICAAVSALVHVTLGRRLLVWGGHPAITPMIWVVAKDMGVNYGSWVKLYQSRFFKDEFPDDNDQFKNVVYTDAVDGDREKSLLQMRVRMFGENAFTSAVFIGGMGGILQEYEILQKLRRRATVLPVVSTGGATLQVAEDMKEYPRDLKDDLDYVTLFHRRLGISPKEKRYKNPEDQPAKVDERYWRPDSAK